MRSEAAERTLHGGMRVRLHIASGSTACERVQPGEADTGDAISGGGVECSGARPILLGDQHVRHVMARSSDYRSL
ncbi:hypothetical protein GUJ93_ZPchr0008g13435 [Zizania palustris]|uniref:Uncharacterized protein n=1 Tax=Zizania palustris TaxID=103762 RepID=A0A8J5RX99_ZIZPA|nr:hypothetical protein GUJ93_ZPchr0008g13435 [Zizania palustris]